VPTLAEKRITRARRAGAQAVKRAAEAKSNPRATRSTATRASYKEKALGLDKVLEILSENGKRPTRPRRKR
jgi:hypothetical protein